MAVYALSGYRVEKCTHVLEYGGIDLIIEPNRSRRARLFLSEPSVFAPHIHPKDSVWRFGFIACRFTRYYPTYELLIGGYTAKSRRDIQGLERKVFRSREMSFTET